MTAKKYRIKLTLEEQHELEALVSRGRVAAYKQTHARILLMSDEAQAGGAMKDNDIAHACALVVPQLRGCAADASKKVLKRHWAVSSSCAAARKSSMVRPKPT